MDKDKKREIVVLICCLIASFALWLYISNDENPIISYELKNVPVQLVNVEKLSYNNLILAENKDYYVNLNIKGALKEVRNARKSDFKIIADLDAYVLKTGNNTIPIKIENYPESISIENLRYSINVTLDDLIEKSIPVEVVTKGNPPEGYYVGTPIVRPTNVMISGAARSVNAVEKLKAEVDVQNFKSDTQLTSTIRAVDIANRVIEDVKIDESVVDVLVPIDRAKTVKIEVRSSGKTPSDIELKELTPSISEVEIAGKNDMIENIESIKTGVIDLTEIKESTTIEVPLIIPSGVRIADGRQKIKVNIEVEKIIERETSYMIEIKNLSDDFEAKLETNTIKIRIKGKESIINNFDYRNIECYVDLKEIKEGTHIVPITIKAPQSVEVVYLEINSVKVEITPKSTETNTGVIEKKPDDEEEKEETDNKGQTEQKEETKEKDADHRVDKRNKVEESYDN